MKFKQTIYIQAREDFLGEITVNAFTHEMKTPNYLTIDVQTVEFECPDINDEKIKLEQIKALLDQKEQIKNSAAESIINIDEKLKELGSEL